MATEKRSSRKAPPRPGNRTGNAAAGAAGRRQWFELGGIPNFKNPSNAAQSKAWDVAESNRVSFLCGVAGTGKTHCAMAVALHNLIVRGSVSKIVMCRPAVTAGEKVGFLPGELEAKLNPYMMPMYDVLGEMVSDETIEKLRASIETVAIGYLRGRTFRNAFVIVDEAQNCTEDQLKLAMTRLGRGSRMIITGDPGQSDLPPHQRSAFGKLLLRVEARTANGGKDLTVFRFADSDIVRDPLVGEIIGLFPANTDEPASRRKAGPNVGRGRRGQPGPSHLLDDTRPASIS